MHLNRSKTYTFLQYSLLTLFLAGYIFLLNIFPHSEHIHVENQEWVVYITTIISVSFLVLLFIYGILYKKGYSTLEKYLPVVRILIIINALLSAALLPALRYGQISFSTIRHLPGKVGRAEILL